MTVETVEERGMTDYEKRLDDIIRTAICYSRTKRDTNHAENNIAFMMSKDLQLACEIYHFELIGHPASFSTLVQSLTWTMTKMDVSHALDTCMDWMLAYRESGDLGELMPGRAGFVWLADEDAKYKLKPLYERYWKDSRQVYTLNGKTY